MRFVYVLLRKQLLRSTKFVKSDKKKNKKKPFDITTAAAATVKKRRSVYSYRYTRAALALPVQLHCFRCA